ncbi:MAG: hypothetical protein EHM31_05120 [Candidatus Aminicenantes bacterium]|nr:MAG: hypothetical protein EHM31_05120 [Candidatus Aminicenantes bacterium]
MSTTDFSSGFLQNVLDLLWAQWCVLGIAGHSRGLRGDCVDPEALIIATCLFGRYDQRLFDAMLEWLARHEDLISSQRLFTLSRKEFPESVEVLKAVAAYLFLHEKKHKWRRFGRDAQPAVAAEPFFISLSGPPMSVSGDQAQAFLAYGFSRGPIEKRGQLGNFSGTHPATLWIRLRAFMGVSSRTEICTYLMTHEDGGHPSLIARVIGYAQGGFHQALVSMCESGWVLRSERRHEVIYTLSDSVRKAFVGSLQGRPHWLTWPRLFHAVLIVWTSLGSKDHSSRPPEVQSAELRWAMQKAAPDLSILGLSGYFMEIQNQKGADYVQALKAAWHSLFSVFHEQGVE